MATTTTLGTSHSSIFPFLRFIPQSRAAGFVGIACLIIALVTSVTDSVWAALPRTYVQIAIAAFLLAIWSLLYELRDRGH